jgi:transposase
LIGEKIPASHSPHKRIRRLADPFFDRFYTAFYELQAAGGRASVPPEQQLLVSLCKVLNGIRSHQLLWGQLNYNLLFRWFVGLSPYDPICYFTPFTNHRERFLNWHVMGHLLEELMISPAIKPLLSDQHFSVDGSSLQVGPPHHVWPERIDGQAVLCYHRQVMARGLVLHHSTVDPDPLLCQKSDAHPALPSQERMGADMNDGTRSYFAQVRRIGVTFHHLLRGWYQVDQRTPQHR